jgi:hypothetical protein
MSEQFSNVIGIAYVDTEKQQQELNKRRKNKKKNKNTGCMNALFEWFAMFYLSDKKYCHCEVAFQKESGNYDDLTCLAYGVFTDKGVFEEKRTFSNPAYQWIYIKITEQQKINAIKFCKSQVGKEFDYWGAHLMPFWAGKEPKGDKWWCGSFTLAALHHANILTECRIGAMNIDNIIEILENHPKKINSMSPYDVYQMQEYFNDQRNFV